MLPVIPLHSGNDRAVSLRHVIATGRAELSNLPGNTCLIDLKNQHASTVKAIDTLTHQVMNDLRSNPEMQTLLGQSEWGKPQRERYEQLLSEAVASRAKEQPLFGHYRPDDPQRSGPADLTNLTPSDPMDCKRLAMIKGIAMQRVEDSLLQGGGNALRRPSEYYLAGGICRENQRPADLHEVIVSSATGNLVEATGNRQVYVRSQHAYGFSDFVSGMPFAGSTTQPDGTPTPGSHYVFGGNRLPEAGIVQSRRVAWERGDAATLGRLTNRTPAPGNETLEGLDRGTRMIAARDQACRSGDMRHMMQQLAGILCDALHTAPPPSHEMPHARGHAR